MKAKTPPWCQWLLGWKGPVYIVSIHIANICSPWSVCQIWLCTSDHIKLHFNLIAVSLLSDNISLLQNLQVIRYICRYGLSHAFKTSLPMMFLTIPLLWIYSVVYLHSSLLLSFFLSSPIFSSSLPSSLLFLYFLLFFLFSPFPPYQSFPFLSLSLLLSFIPLNVFHLLNLYSSEDCKVLAVRRVFWLWALAYIISKCFFSIPPPTIFLPFWLSGYLFLFNL